MRKLRRVASLIRLPSKKRRPYPTFKLSSRRHFGFIRLWELFYRALSPPEAWNYLGTTSLLE